MDIRILMNRLDNIEQSSGIKKYISEGLYSTPEMQQHWKRLDEGFFQGYEKYLAEVALTPDQIQNIFKQAGGSASGEAPKDAGKLAAIVDKVMPSSQAASLGSSLPEPNAGPVQGFEQKAAAAVQNLGVDSGTKQSLMQMVKAGIKKPETQQLILAAVGAGLGSLISKIGPVLSMIPGGGPVASAITGAVVAGGVAVLAAKLRGEDWKSAFKGAIKPALMGGASAVVGNLVTSGISAMMAGGDKAGQDGAAGGGQGSPEQQKALAADQAFQDSMLKKYPPDQGYTFGASGDSLQVFDANGRKVFTGDIPLKTMDMKTFADLTNNGQMATPGTTSGAVASDPKAGISDGSGKRGDSGWNSMKANTNADGSPMTLDQINQAKADLRAGNANNMADSPEDFSGTATPDQVKAADDAIYKQAKAAGATGSTSNQQFTGGENPNADAFRKQAQDQIALNQRMQAQADAGGIGKNFDAGIAPTGPNGQPMRAVPMDSPAIGQNFDAGIAPLGPNGQPMQAVPMDEPAAPQGINRLTGKPLQAAPAWDQMTPDQQAATTAKQQQQAADAAQGTQNAKDYWANKNPNTRGLKESFAESVYVDKQATLKMWLEQEAKGFAVAGLALKPAVKEGIMDSLKGMFGGKGKGKEAAPAAGGVTADALNKAWTAAGSPTDSEEVAKVLQSAGVPAETVNKVFADLKLPAPGAAATPADAAAPGDTPADAAAPGANPADATATGDTPADTEKPTDAPAAGMKADEIVTALQTFWDQATASQDSRTTSPQVQQQIKAMAKSAAMSGQVFESKYWNNK